MSDKTEVDWFIENLEEWLMDPPETVTMEDRVADRDKMFQAMGIIKTQKDIIKMLIKDQIK